MTILMDFIVKESHMHNLDIIDYELYKYNVYDIDDIDRMIYCQYHEEYIISYFLKNGYKISNNYILLRMIDISKKFLKYVENNMIVIHDNDIDMMLKYKDETLNNMLYSIKFGNCHNINLVIELDKYKEQYNGIERYDIINCNNYELFNKFIELESDDIINKSPKMKECLIKGVIEISSCDICSSDENIYNILKKIKYIKIKGLTVKLKLYDYMQLTKDIVINKGKKVENNYTKLKEFTTEEIIINDKDIDEIIECGEEDLEDILYNILYCEYDFPNLYLKTSKYKEFLSIIGKYKIKDINNIYNSI
jgi:hypothetical protein